MLLPVHQLNRIDQTVSTPNSTTCGHSDKTFRHIARKKAKKTFFQKKWYKQQQFLTYAVVCDENKLKSVCCFLVVGIEEF